MSISPENLSKVQPILLGEGPFRISSHSDAYRLRVWSRAGMPGPEPDNPETVFTQPAAFTNISNEHNLSVNQASAIAGALTKLSTIDNNELAPEPVVKKGPRGYLKRRWNALKTRASLLALGDVENSLGTQAEDGELKLVTKRRMIGAAVIIAAGVGVIIAYQANKNGVNVDSSFGDGSIRPKVPDWAHEHASEYQRFHDAGTPDQITQKIFEEPADFVRFGNWIAKTKAEHPGIDGIEKDMWSRYVSDVVSNGNNGIPGTL